MHTTHLDGSMGDAPGGWRPPKTSPSALRARLPTGQPPGPARRAGEVDAHFRRKGRSLRGGVGPGGTAGAAGSLLGGRGGA